MRTHRCRPFRAAWTVILLASTLSLGCARDRGNVLTGWLSSDQTPERTAAADTGSRAQVGTARSERDSAGARVTANAGTQWRAPGGRSAPAQSRRSSRSGHGKGVVYLSSYRDTGAEDSGPPRDPFLHRDRTTADSPFPRTAEVRSAERSAPQQGRGRDVDASARGRSWADSGRDPWRSAGDGSSQVQELRERMQQDLAERRGAAPSGSGDIPAWAAASDGMASNAGSRGASSSGDSTPPLPPLEGPRANQNDGSTGAEAVANTSSAAKNVEFLPPPPGDRQVAQDRRRSDPLRGRLTGKAERGMIVDSDSVRREFSRSPSSRSRFGAAPREDDTVYPIIRSAGEQSRSLR